MRNREVLLYDKISLSLQGGQLTLTLRARGFVFQRGSVDMGEISSRQTITIFYGGLTSAAQHRGENEGE